MTIAHLLVKLGAETAEFHQAMDRAARRTERTGKVFTKIGREISQAISLPLIAGAFGAFHLLLAESARSFGPLFQAVENLKAAAHNLFLAIGRELEPTFRQIIALLRSGIATLQGWIAAFHELPEGVRKAIIFGLAFLAVLGPTLFVVGKLITAIGALGRILPLLVTPTGLAVLAIMALAAAALYVATHWDEVKLRLVLAWTAVKIAVFDSVHAILTALGNLLEGGAAVSQAYSFMPGLLGAAFGAMAAALKPAAEAIRDVTKRFDAFADRSLANSAAKILELEAALRTVTTPLQDTTAFARAAAEAFAAYNLAIRNVNANVAIFGAEFNKNAASAAALKAEIDALTAAAIRNGVALFAVTGAGGESLVELARRYGALADGARMYQQALNLLGPTLADHARLLELATARGINLDTITRQQLEGLSAYAESLAAINNTIRTAIIDAWTALGEQIGGILSGMAQGFRGLGNKMLGILGGLLKAVGQALIASGIAATTILSLFANPFAAIAAGVGLVALGSALAGAAQSSVNNAMAGGGGGGFASSAAVAAAPAEDQGTLIVRLDSNFRRLNPDFVDIIAHALEEAKSRNVIVEEGD